MDYNLSQINVIEFPKNDFDALFKEIKKRPQIILPRHSIFDLHAFYLGYIFYRDKNDIPASEGDIKFEVFLNWAIHKFEIQTNMSWANLIFAYSSDERSALDYLFRLHDQFISISVVE